MKKIQHVLLAAISLTLLGSTAWALSGTSTPAKVNPTSATGLKQGSVNTGIKMDSDTEVSPIIVRVVSDLSLARIFVDAILNNRNKYYVSWRGFTLNPDNMGTYGDAKARITTTTGGLSGSGEQTIEVQSEFKVNLTNTAENNGSNVDESDSDEFDAKSRFTVVSYDNSAMKVSANHSVTISFDNNVADNTTVTEYDDPIYVPETFSSWYSGVDVEDVDMRYEYYVALRGHRIECESGIDAENFTMNAYISNGSHVNTNEPDENGNDHYIGEDSYIRPIVKVLFTQPDNMVDHCSVTIYYDVIGIDNTKLDVAWYGWDSDGASGSGSNDSPRSIPVTVPEDTSKNNMFVITGLMKFNDGDIDAGTDHVSWQFAYFNTSIDSVSGTIATVMMDGSYITIYDGAVGTHDERHVRPNGSWGYLIYAKDGKSIKATESSSEINDAEGSATLLDSVSF